MKLTTKILLIFALAMAVVTAVYGLLAVKREDEIFQERARVEAQRFAEVVRRTLTDRWEEDLPQRLIRLFESQPRDAASVEVRWVWFDRVAKEEERPAVEYRWDRISIRETVSLVAIEPNGDRNLYTYLPMRNPLGRPGGLEFVSSMEGLEAAKRATIGRTFATLAVLIAVVGAVVFFFGVNFLGKPLRKLIEKTRRVAEGDLAEPVHVPHGDELGELADSINHMCEQIQASQERAEQEAGERLAAMDQLRHADRLRTVGRLASGIAHELGTPLSVVSGRAELIVQGNLSGEEAKKSAEAIRTESQRMAAIIRQLLDFARRGHSARHRTDLRELVESTCDLLGPLAAKSNVPLVMNASSETLAAEADAGQLQQALTNLIVNAVHASEYGSEVVLRLTSVVARPPDGDEEQEFVCVAIEDSGHGISPENLPHIFEPFFTTKEVGDGTGLGLSITHGIVEEQGGLDQSG